MFFNEKFQPVCVNMYVLHSNMSTCLWQCTGTVYSSSTFSAFITAFITPTVQPFFDLCFSTITTLHDYNMNGSLYFLIQHFIPFGANISTLLNPTFRPFWGQHFNPFGAIISTLLGPTFRPFWGQHFDPFGANISTLFGANI